MSRFIKIGLISLLAIVGSKPTVAAIVITDAFVNLYDKVVVKGKYAQPYSYISWEDTVVDKAGATGSFSFKSSVVPEDCVGKLSDGTETIDVNIDNCTPKPTAEGIPSGVIVMWSGSVSNIPEGWALCDGANGTPDLRDRFIVGAGSGYSPGNTGGTNTNNISNHTHSIPAEGPGTSGVGDHQHSFSGSTGNPYNDIKEVGSGSTDVGGDEHRHNFSGTTSAAGSHSHTVNSHSHGGTTGAGGSASLDNRPLYFALAFIMKL